LRIVDWGLGIADCGLRIADWGLKNCPWSVVRSQWPQQAAAPQLTFILRLAQLPFVLASRLLIETIDPGRRTTDSFSIRNPQSAIRNPQSTIRNPQSAIEMSLYGLRLVLNSVV
jgi:hypothetical protein